MAQIVRATSDQVKRIREMMAISVANLPSRDWFVDDDEAYIARHIDQEGYTLVFMEEDVLAGFLMVHHPGLGEENLGRHLDLSPDQLLKCAHMESTSVLPEYQGRHILSRLIDHASQIEQETFHMKYLLATVHPDNLFSYNSLIRCGFTPMMTFPKYNGWLRTLMQKQLT